MKLAIDPLTEAANHLSEDQAIGLILHSLSLGFFLMLITAIISHLTGTASQSKSAKATPNPTPGEIILNAANVLYLCLGMTGMMILVSNNLARAFAIGAAIALVRFRVKVDSKSFAMCLFFGVLIGMACGVQQVRIAYGMSIIFAFLQVAVYGLSKLADRLSPSEEFSSTTRTRKVDNEINAESAAKIFP